MANKQASLVLLVVLVAVLILNVASQDDVSWDPKKTKETTESWTGWAVNKLWKGLGLKNDDSVDHSSVRLNKDQIDEEVVLSQQSPSDLAGGEDNVNAYDKATEKAHQAKQAAYETAKEAANKASSLKDAAAEKAHEATEKAKQFTKQASENTVKIKDKANQHAKIATEDVRDAVHKEAKDEEGSEESESMSWVKSKAKEGYDGVKERATKTMHNAKEMAKDMVSPQYDEDDDEL